MTDTAYRCMTLPLGLVIIGVTVDVNDPFVILTGMTLNLNDSLIISSRDLRLTVRTAAENKIFLLASDLAGVLRDLIGLDLVLRWRVIQLARVDGGWPAVVVEDTLAHAGARAFMHSLHLLTVQNLHTLLAGFRQADNLTVKILALASDHADLVGVLVVVARANRSALISTDRGVFARAFLGDLDLLSTVVVLGLVVERYH